MSSKRLLRKLVVRCDQCEDVTTMIAYDTADEIVAASLDVRRLIREGKTFDVIEHEPGDPQPNWCACHP